VFARISLACSSEQKNTDSRQKSAMIFGAANLEKSTNGWEINGFVPPSRILERSSLSISMLID
ncbi:MAG: hypothetical protein L7F78_15875, partial [Syntrophales bacterium LBB04]|nr:hypothetical protein [Syntrophales bacterium LBB04]